MSKIDLEDARLGHRLKVIGLPPYGCTAIFVQTFPNEPDQEDGIDWHFKLLDFIAQHLMQSGASIVDIQVDECNLDRDECDLGIVRL